MAANTVQYQEQTTSNIPKAVEPAFTRLVGDTEQFAQQPYQYYQGQRFGDINPLQQQYMQGTTNLQPSEQLGSATNLANQAGLGALNSGMFGDAEAQQYMSPYIQHVLEMQKQAAVSDYGRQMPGMGSAAAQAGGLGGTRSALMQMEGQRNLQNSLQGIQATGLQNAYQQAQAQYNADQARRMQGYNTANQSASTLGQLGATDYDQQLGALNAQRTAGQDLYGLQQQQKDFDYSQFAEEQNLPYKQLGLRSDVIRGIPLGGQSTTVYGNSSPAAQTIGNVVGGLGLLRAGGN